MTKVLPILAVLLAVVCGFEISIGVASAQIQSTATGITLPSRRLKLQFYSPGLVREVLVQAGQEVQPGEVLAVQDDSIEVKQLEGLKIEAESLLTVAAQKTDLAQKQVTLARKKRMHEQGRAASDEEVEQAQLDVDLAVIRVELADQERLLKSIEAQKQEVRIELMKRTSPIKGVVEMITVREGEFADINRPEGAIVVVQNDPLWVELLDLSSKQVKDLKLGQELEVIHDGEPMEMAKIIYVASVVDAASDTRLVRLAMPNPTGRASGLHVQVKMPGAQVSKDAVGTVK